MLSSSSHGRYAIFATGDLRRGLGLKAVTNLALS